MNKLLTVEIFGSNVGEKGKLKTVIQGEGKFAGTPTIFIRTFGCNLRCAFGDPERKELNEVRQNAHLIQSLDDFPILKTGCDTSYSIFPEFMKFTTWYTVEELIAELKTRIDPNKPIPHIVFTGGEPLLGKWQDFYAEFIPLFVNEIGETQFTFETNGTQKLTSNFKTFQRFYWKFISFSISPKLSNSGHKSNETLQASFVKEYLRYDHTNSWFKFVVNSEQDLEEIEFFVRKYNCDCSVYLMPQGGTREEYLINEPIVYDICSRYGYHFSPRLQVSAASNGIGI